MFLYKIYFISTESTVINKGPKRSRRKVNCHKIDTRNVVPFVAEDGCDVNRSMQIEINRRLYLISFYSTDAVKRWYR